MTSRPAASARPNASSSSAARALAAGALEAEQAAEQDQVLAAREVLVDGRHLAGEADEAADRVGLLDDVVPEHARVPPSGASSVASIRIVVVLPAPLGPSTP